MLLSLRPSRAVALFVMARAIERWDPAKHPRIPKGLPDGGQFLTLDERMQVALHSGGDLKGFSRPSLMRGAKDRGVYVRRGASEDELRSALEKDIKDKGVSEKARQLSDALGALDTIGAAGKSDKLDELGPKKAAKPDVTLDDPADVERRIAKLDAEIAARRSRNMPPTANQKALRKALGDRREELIKGGQPPPKKDFSVAGGSEDALAAAYTRTPHPTGDSKKIGEILADARAADLKRDDRHRFGVAGSIVPKPAAPTVDEIAAGHRAKKAAKKAVPKSTALGAKDAAQRLDTAKTRGEAHAVLDGMTVAQLRDVADARGMPYLKGSPKARLKDDLVEFTAGDRLDSGALRDLSKGMMNPTGLRQQGDASNPDALVKALPEGPHRTHVEKILAGQQVERDKLVTTPSKKALLLRSQARAERNHAKLIYDGNPTDANRKKYEQAERLAGQIEAIADQLAGRPGRQNVFEKKDAAKVQSDFAEAVARPMPSDRERFKKELGTLTGSQLADIAAEHGLRLPSGTKQAKVNHLVEFSVGYRLNSEAIRHSNIYGERDLDRINAELYAADLRGDRAAYERLHQQREKLFNVGTGRGRGPKA